jgi:hypothetical protein
METLGMENDIKRYGLENEISSGYSEFDPGFNNNKRLSRWKLKAPDAWKKDND